MTAEALAIDTIQHMNYEDGIGLITDGSIDLILCDPPYGVTACSWDQKPDLAFMWREFNRILKEDGAAIVTATQPFATDVIESNRKNFRYDLIWAKSNPVGFLNAKRMPLRQHELVLVFYRRMPTYTPQMIPAPKRSYWKGKDAKAGVYAAVKALAYESHARYPTSLIPFDKDGAGRGRHPTQKPLSLFEYLVKTYSAPGDLVFDPFMGSGTTAVASVRTGRHYLGFEREREYLDMAMTRLSSSEALPEPILETGLVCLN